MAFDPKDNPLADVRVPVFTENRSARLSYWLLHGTLNGYKEPHKIESMKKRHKRDKQRDF